MDSVDDLLARLEERFRPLEVELAHAWWDANVESNDETEQRRQDVELRLRTALGDADLFADVRDGMAAAAPGSPAHRQLERLHAQMLPNQLDDATRRRLVELETKVEALFNTHRGEIDGERVDDNRIAEILLSSDDNALRRKAWEASKSIGPVVAGLVRELVELRNEAARGLGYDDHYAMALSLGELDGDRLATTLAEVEAVTDEPFREWKAATDERRAERFGITVDELRPWHYDDPFFQDPPPVDGVDLDRHLAGADIEALTLRTYDGLGIDLRPVLARSDLYARDAKCQHAFCIDLDRRGDVRVLCNVVPSERWMETMLHEFGHAAYDRHVDGELPFFLHEPSHTLTTEAVAMLMGRLSRDPEWLQAIAGLPARDLDASAPALHDGARGRALVFARWALVMCHFERGLYQQPDADHDARWWDLVERLQLVRRPDGRRAPDWAAKIHLAVAPVYYQNYLYGELVASQVQAALRDDAGGIVDRPMAGAWLVDRVFRPGASRRWDRLLADATGHPLTARHFADELTAA